MNNPHPEFGGRRLSDPGVSQQLDTMTAEDRISPMLERRKYLRRESDRKAAEYVRRFYEETDVKETA